MYLMDTTYEKGILDLFHKPNNEAFQRITKSQHQVLLGSTRRVPVPSVKKPNYQ